MPRGFGRRLKTAVVCLGVGAVYNVYFIWLLRAENITDLVYMDLLLLIFGGVWLAGVYGRLKRRDRELADLL